MAIALDANSNSPKMFAFAGTSGTSAASVTAGGVNRLLTVQIAIPATTATITSVTYGGVAMTAATSAAVTSNRAAIYYLVNPNAGTANVVITLSTAVIFCEACIVSWTGIAQTLTLGTPATANGTSTSPSSGAVTNTAGDLVIDMCSVPTSTVFSAPSGTVLLTPMTSNAESQYTTVVNPTMSYTLAASKAWVIVACPFKAAATTDVGPPITSATTVSFSEMRIAPYRTGPWGFSHWQDPAQRNLIANGDFETNLTGWEYQGSTGSISRVTGGKVGTYCMRVNCTNAGVAEQVICTESPTLDPAVWYTLQAWVRPANGGQVLMGGGIVTTPVGDGTTWYRLTNTALGASNAVFQEATAASGTFSVDNVQLYATPALIENNAASWETSGLFPKVFGFTVDGSGNMVWDDIWTLPSVAPAGACAITACPTPNSPNGSFLVTTQDAIILYPLPFNFDPTETAYPRLAASTSSATYSTDLVPIHYPSAIDLGTGLYELVALACVGANFTYETDAWAFSFRWDETAAWSTVQSQAQPNATFKVLSDGQNRGSVLHLAISIYDAANTDPVGPHGRHIVAWVRKLDGDASNIRQVTRTIPEGG